MYARSLITSSTDPSPSNKQLPAPPHTPGCGQRSQPRCLSVPAAQSVFEAKVTFPARVGGSSGVRHAASMCRSHRAPAPAAPSLHLAHLTFQSHLSRLTFSFHLARLTFQSHLAHLTFPSHLPFSPCPSHHAHLTMPIISPCPSHLAHLTFQSHLALLAFPSHLPVSPCPSQLAHLSGSISTVPSHRSQEQWLAQYI